MGHIKTPCVLSAHEPYMQDSLTLPVSSPGFCNYLAQVTNTNISAHTQFLLQQIINTIYKPIYLHQLYLPKEERVIH